MQGIDLVVGVSHNLNGKAVNMSSEINQDDVVSLREALNMEIVVNQALIDILVSKGIFTQEELMEKIEEVSYAMLQANSSSSQ